MISGTVADSGLDIGERIRRLEAENALLRRINADLKVMLDMYDAGSGLPFEVRIVGRESNV